MNLIYSQFLISQNGTNSASITIENFLTKFFLILHVIEII